MASAADVPGIAIIGIGCRFPGQANSPEKFWELLRDGVDAITDLPPERFDLESVYHDDPGTAGKMYVRRGGTIENIEEFDAEFFGISPREARYIDPQHRLLLEVAYEALDDAGLPLQRVSGSTTGVFVGISTHDYGDVQMYPSNRDQISSHSNSGTATSIAANRLSYLYNLKGPSMTVDTACSSALTAVHLACQSLRNGECSLALVGGAQILLTPEVTIGFCKASMLSPTATCRAFDADANGYVRSEGVGVIVLKPLAAALADGDSIYAVIAGSAINQDGHTTGMTVPSQEAQSEMFTSALARAGWDPEDVHYIEAHGTGTPVGDPIEANAIGGVLGGNRRNGNACVIGSVKTNIGHLEAASGMAGIIKTALAIHHRAIPPSLHFRSPNPAINFAALGLRVATSLEPWPTKAPATAGVNSFGFGGANAHVLLREAPHPEETVSPSPTDPGVAHLLPISARSTEALAATARKYRTWLEANPQSALADVCHTAALRRTHHQYRAALVASSRDEMIDALDALVAGEQRNNIAIGRASAEGPAKLAFVFGGMGPQWWGMGRQLMRDEPLFREIIEQCDSLLAPLSGWSLLDLLRADEVSSRVGEADVAQVTNFAIQAALTALWKSWGITPNAVIGHSAGGIAAAHVSGAHDLPQSILLAYHRSRLQSRASGTGSMLAVALSAAEAEKAIGQHAARVSLGAVNSPCSCALTGDTAALETIQLALQEQGVFARMLQVSVPYHSAAMDPIETELRAVLRPLTPRQAVLGLVSDNTGNWADGTDYDAGYWWKTVREPVRFSEGIATLLEAGFTTFVEVGPHPVLAASLAEGLAAKDLKGKILPSIRRLEDERHVMLRSLGSLWTVGHPVRWETLHPGNGAFTKLPTYAWQKERHWYTSAVSTNGAIPAAGADKYEHPLLGLRIRMPTPRWEAILGQAPQRWIEDHLVHNAVVFPGAAYVEMALAVAAQPAPDKTLIIRDFEFTRALFLRPDATTILQTSLESGGRVTIHSTTTAEDQSWIEHARARIETRPPEEEERVALDVLEQRCPNESGRDECYAALAERGLQYGPAFRGIARLRQGEQEALGQIDASALALDPKSYSIHPALLDAAFQVLIGAASNPNADGAERRRLFLPVGIDSVTWHRSPGPIFRSHARVIRRDPTTLVGDVDVLDEDGLVCVQVRGLRCQLLEGATTRGEDPLADWLYQYNWEPAPLADAETTAIARHSALLSADFQEPANARSTQSGWARYYNQVEPKLNGLAAQLAADALRALRWDPREGDGGTMTTLLDDLRIARPAIPLARCLIELLATEEYFSIEGETWRCKARLPRINAVSLGHALLEAEAAYQTDVALMLRCGGALPGILRGEAAARAVLFDADAIAELRRFYREAPASAYYNKLLIDAVGSVVAASDQTATLRVVELGGGTGGCTAPLLASLPAERIAYTFTDITPFFVTAAEREFGAHAGFKAVTLDLEKDLAEQGFASHRADIVVAANVLHATADLAQSLARARELLAPGGLLVLLEITRRPPWLNVIFGVTDGWWKFADKKLRPHHPLLEPEQWQTLLAAQGFEDITTLADTNHSGIAGQTVFLAHSGTENPVARVSANEATKWLIVSDRAGTGARLAETLGKWGDAFILVTPGRELQRRAGNFEVRPDNLEDFRAVLAELRDKAINIPGIILLNALDSVEVDHADANSILEAQREICGWPRTILAALDAEAFPKPPDFIFVTAGAQSVTKDDALNLGQAPLWGWARVMFRERPDIRCQLIDLDPGLDEAGLHALAAELRARTSEEEVALRGTGRWVHRLARPVAEQTQATVTHRAPAEDELWQIEIETPGALATLRVESAVRMPPPPELVEIAIAAAALNFRDVMLATGLIPTVATEPTFGKQGLGLDCAGRISRCGPGTEGFSPGDDVIAIAPTALASFANTRAELVAHKPASLSFEEAAAIPCAFVTAYYALERLAQLKAGERVLIHAATGGVGLAAIQIARAVGAEIFVTAGNPEKRAYLKSLGLERIMDSRSLAFADEILASTNGRGVDVVLNSLAGEAIARGIAILSPYGRFVEIGKRDIYADSKIGLLAFRKNLSFFAVDLDRLCNERPALAGEMLREVVRRFEAGVYSPLPQHVFPASEAEAAMRLMAQAKHMGKIVLQTADPLLRVRVPKPLFRSDATYLITGGLGGFGLATAQWMVREGVRSLVLMGRSAPEPATLTQIQALTAAGARVEFAQGDVTNAEDVRRVVAHIRAQMSPLRGIIHAAMVLADAPISEMNADRLQEALAPKMTGAWNLHLATLEDDLDHFVLYSSIATIFGNPMQSNYSAANAFLDALAHHRHALRRPALSVNWGVVSDAGYVAAHPEIAQYLEARGYGGFTTEQALETLAALMRSEAAQMIVARVDWERLAASAPATAGSPGFQSFGTAARANSSQDDKSASLRKMLAGTADPAERLSVLQDWLREKAGRALGIAAQRLDLEKPLTEIGLDSLIAVELVTVLKMEIDFDLPAVKLLQGLNIRGLAGLILETIPASNECETSAASRNGATPVAAPPPEVGSPIPNAAVAPINGASSMENPERSRPSRNGSAKRFDYTKLDYERLSGAERLARGVARALFAVGTRVQIEGREHIPPRGAFIIASNHLCLTDVPLVFTIMERPVILLADDWLQKNRATRWILGDVGRAIFVGGDGSGDEAALRDSLAVLRSGGIVGLSPEGARSATGALAQARLGMAYLAMQASVPVLPIAAWGHEHLTRSWRRLRRAEVHINIGSLISVPSGNASPVELQERTDQIMRRLAALLPAGYRGAYR